MSSLVSIDWIRENCISTINKILNGEKIVGFFCRKNENLSVQQVSNIYTEFKKLFAIEAKATKKLNTIVHPVYFIAQDITMAEHKILNDNGIVYIDTTSLPKEVAEQDDDALHETIMSTENPITLVNAEIVINHVTDENVNSYLNSKPSNYSSDELVAYLKKALHE
jgi:hypothetical protein